VISGHDNGCIPFLNTKFIYSISVYYNIERKRMERVLCTAFFSRARLLPTAGCRQKREAGREKGKEGVLGFVRLISPLTVDREP
jgi:hypothetical protein